MKDTGMLQPEYSKTLQVHSVAARLKKVRKEPECVFRRKTSERRFPLLIHSKSDKY